MSTYEILHLVIFTIFLSIGLWIVWKASKRI